MKEDKYKVKSEYMVIPHSKDRIEFRSGVWNAASIFLEDKDEKHKLYSIIKQLNGEHSSKEIGKTENLPTSQIEEVIDHMLNLSLLTNKSQDPLEGFLNSYMPIFSQGQASEIKKPVLLLGDAALTEKLAEELKKIIPENLVKIADQNDLPYHELQTLNPEDWLFDGISYLEKVENYSSWKNFFVVLAFENINPIFAENFNRIAHELQIPWMQIAIDGPFLLIGPTFEGGNSPCYSCFEKRIAMNLREHANYQKYKTAIIEKKINNQNAQINPLLLSLIASHGSVEILNYLATGSTFTMRKLLGIYLPTMEIAYNDVLSLAGCPVCGAVTHRTDEQLYFDMQTQLTVAK